MFSKVEVPVPPTKSLLDTESCSVGEVVPIPTLPSLRITNRVVVAVGVELATAKRVVFRVAFEGWWIESCAKGDVVPIPILPMSLFQVKEEVLVIVFESLKKVTCPAPPEPSIVFPPATHVPSMAKQPSARLIPCEKDELADVPVITKTPVASIFPSVVVALPTPNPPVR